MRLSRLAAISSLLGMAAAPRFAHTAIVSSVVNSSSPGLGLQPRPNNLRVCFYGDALTSRADRVAEISGQLQSWAQAAGNVVLTDLGTCPAPTVGTCGTGSSAHPCSHYGGDVRIALDGTSDANGPVSRQIPASFVDCADHGAPSSWSHFPNFVDDPGHRACPYNSAIGDDADTSQSPSVHWLNHPLHEFGHALGYQHEFLQAGFLDFVGPNGKTCSTSLGTPDGAAHPANYVSLTPVDDRSVMMYVDSSCDIRGNYAFTGYSSWDQLGLHILYPETQRVAEFTGTTVVVATSQMSLSQLWVAKGADAKVLQSIKWSIGGLVSTQPTFVTTWTIPGLQSGSLTYTDFLGRRYSTSITVNVLSASDFAARVAATSAALAGM
jgi:hypothetical protein